MIILSIETSCDETAIALIEASGTLNAEKRGTGAERRGNLKFKIIKNLVASQIKIHAPFGGVVPNIAKREHLLNLPILMGKILGISNFQFPIKFQIQNSKFPARTTIQSGRQILDSIDLVAVTVGPGLEPALWTGINFAKQIYAEMRGNNKRRKTQKVELQGVSHLDGHIYSFLLNKNKTASTKHEARSTKNFGFRHSDFEFPAVHLLVSGGHTTLLLMKDLKTVKKIGETVDDAVGEAFDKTARILGLPYPGGPEIEKLAKKGNSEEIIFPRPMLNQKNYNFSFSGLKTSVLYYLRDNKNYKKEDVAASFQKAAFDVLIKKTLRAAEQYKAKSIMISGGVSANKSLAKLFTKELKNLNTKGTHIELLVTQFPTDNASMIAAAAYINYLRKKKYKLTANGNLNI